MSAVPFRYLDIQERDAVTVATLKDCRRPELHIARQIGDELQQVAKTLNPVLVVDFRAVEFFDADMRGQLVRAYRTLESRGGRLAVCHLSLPMKQHFHVIQFDRIMLVVDTLEEALRLLAADNGTPGA